MSTVERPRPANVLPPLVAGQRLDQPTFHARYEAMPDGTWAELVRGVVYMPSPVGLDHSEYDDVSAWWVVTYRTGTKGLKSGRNATTILRDDTEVQPDGHLRIDPELRGQTRHEGGYIAGAPELVAEIARSSRSFDLNEKKDEYERAGVREYIVFELDPDRVHWFIRRGDRFEELQPGPDGIYRSEVFPGLWLDPVAFFAEDFDRMKEVLQQGLASPEHAAFVAELSPRRA